MIRLEHFLNSLLSGRVVHHTIFPAAPQAITFRACCISVCAPIALSAIFSTDILTGTYSRTKDLRKSFMAQ